MDWTYSKHRGKSLYLIHTDSGKRNHVAIVTSKDRAIEWIDSHTTPTDTANHTEYVPRYPETYTYREKTKISREIRSYSPETVDEDFKRLVEIGCDASEKSTRILTGNKVVDQFTFTERLNTVSRKGLSFYEFWANRAEFEKKENLKQFIEYQKRDRNGNNMTRLWYNTYRLYYGSVNIFKPLIAMEYYCLFPPKVAVLDFTMGWGGRLVGACALNIPKYIGIDANQNLEKAYKEMRAFLEPRTTTQIDLYFTDALSVDYSTLEYDMVLTSPPYYNIERYAGVDTLSSKEEWDEEFYRPLFWKTFSNLKKGGHYCLNIPLDVYLRVCVGLLGEAKHKIEFRKESRGVNVAKEFVYVWVR